MDTIKNTAEEFFAAGGFDLDSLEVAVDEQTGTTRVKVRTADAPLFIGKHGEVLYAINHIFKKIAERRFGDSATHAHIDINEYTAKREEEVRSKALMLAERARFFKRDIELDPMNAYDRMLIHTMFKETRDIVTESTGKGMARRVVIKYQETFSPPTHESSEEAYKERF